VTTAIGLASKIVWSTYTLKKYRLQWVSILIYSCKRTESREQKL